MRDRESSIGFLINDVARLLRRNLNRRAQALGLSQAQWRALAYLSVQEGINQVGLADSLEVQPITLARLLDRLQEAGLIERRPDPDDRRAFRLFLTDKAQPLLDHMWSLAVETRTEATDGLGVGSLQVLTEALRHMKRNLLDAEARVASNPA
ncbi:MAG: MarR family winged helix-turn-helix transcriptional regulator, partial [Alphaproteobacteria bacterium]